MPNYGEGETINKGDTAPKPPAWGDQIERQLGLTVRHAVRGATAFPVMVGNAANALLNFIPGVELGDLNSITDRALTDAGLPEPETKLEKLVGGAAEAVAGAGAGLATAGKVAPQLIRGMMTENALAQGTGAAGAGAAMEKARQEDVGVVGQIGAALVGGIFGGAAGAGSARSLGAWIENRAKIDKAVSDAEVAAVVKANGIAATEAQTKQVQEAINKIKEASQVRQATLDALVPDLKKTSVEVGRERARVARKDFEETIKGAFESDAEMKDFVDRVVKGKQTQQAIDANAPIEVQRARQRLGVQADRDAQIMRDIRARQEALLAKLEADRTVPETQVIRDAVNAPVREAITRNENVLRTVDDELSAWQVVGQKAIKRLENISPRIATAVRKVTVQTNRNITDRVTSIKGWLEDAPIQKAIRKSPEFKAAVLNRDIDAMDRLVPGSGAKYEPVAKMLDDYRARLVADGKPIIEDGIHPRAVRDVKNLRKSMNRPQQEAFDKARAALMKSKGRDYLTAHEEAGLIGQFVAGHPVKQFRGRTIYEVTPDMAKHYLNPDISLIDYIHTMEENLATKAFFKNTLGKDVAIGDSLSADQLRGHLGDVIATGVREGDLRSNDVNELASLLNAHFGAGRQGPGEFLQKSKDFFTGMTLGFNPLSTATQIADIGISAAKFGPINTLKAQFGPKVADLYESGLRNMAAEVRSPHTAAQWFVKKGLRTLGFEKVDRLGNKVAMNAAFRKRFTQATKSEGKLLDELKPLFGDADARKLIEDLKARRYTDDVATLMAHDVADIRPIGREDMPVSYLNNPKGRVLYSLLSWSVNQLNYVRNAAFKDIEEGLRMSLRKDQSTKAGAAKMAKGIGKLIAMTTAFGLANVPAGITKDLMQGKELDPVAHFAAGAVPFGMSGRFMVEQLMSYDPARAAGNALPIVGITANAIGRTLSGVWDGEWDKVIQATPTGRSLYKVLTGEGIEGVVGVLGAIIPRADAAFAPDGYDATQGATYLPAEPVPAANNLPAGSVPLEAPPQYIDPQEQERLRAEIQAEQDQRQQETSAARLISQFETDKSEKGGWTGEKWVPYKSIEGGTDTIAHGHKLTPPEVKKGTIRIGGVEVPYKKGLDEEQALALLQQDTDLAATAVDKLVTKPLSPQQKAALTSLVYNVGIPQFAGSQALKALNAGNMAEFRKQAFSREHGWTHVGKKVVEGLVNRRNAEARLFFGE